MKIDFLSTLMFYTLVIHLCQIDFSKPVHYSIKKVLTSSHTASNTICYIIGMKNISIIISSTVVSGLILFISRSNPNHTLEGLTDRLWILPVYFIVVPLIFGLIGFVYNSENRIKKSLISFGISLLIAIIVAALFSVL